MVMYGYVGLCMRMYGYVSLGRVTYGYVYLCRVMHGDVWLCMAIKRLGAIPVFNAMFKSVGPPYWITTTTVWV